MSRASLREFAAAIVVAFIVSASPAAEISVAPGESLQAAIDNAPPGATIKLAEGAYPEGLIISKPITLLGAGWEKTSIGSDKQVPLTQRQKDEFFAGLDEDSKPLPEGNIVADPKFAAPDKRDYTLAADSPARKMGAGVADPIAMTSPFPMQPEERAMIPDTETRDYSKWKKVAGAQ